MKIGIFDSGMGGLNVLKDIVTKHPNNQYIYFGDTINLPYGNKSKEQLIQMSSKIVEFLEKKSVDLIIIACGTCSCTVLEILKNKFSTPIIGILEPTINYLNKKNYRKIGVIATEMTIKTNYFEQHLPAIEVSCLATPKLVPLIENNLINTSECDIVLKEYLNNFKDIETLVLGCTHYKSIKEKIPNLPLIDMGEILSDSLILPNDGKFKLTMYFSDLNEHILEKTTELFGNCEKYEVRL